MHYPAQQGTVMKTASLGGRRLDAVLSATLARHGLTLPGPARGWPAWPYDSRAPVAGPHLLCVGDAAGIDALTGEGIAVGLEQGLIAARTIASGFARADLRFQEYVRTIRRAVVGRELVLDGCMARLLYGSADFRPWLGLVMLDEAMLGLYAARVCGSEVLSDRKGALLAALTRHFFRRRRRARALQAAVA
jgi:flavin-dependent dehydrogenase